MPRTAALEQHRAAPEGYATNSRPVSRNQEGAPRAQPPTDLRVRRTRALLKSTLVALLRERDYAQVTVADLAERAMINRATFYRHYADLHELVFDCVDDLLLEVPGVDLGEAFALRPGEALPTVVGYFEHVARHADFYRAMLGERGMPGFGERLRAGVEAGVTLEFRSPRIEVDVAATVSAFIAHALLGVTRSWLVSRKPMEPQRVAALFTALVLPGVRQVVGR
jgi:AcrR family transcriptional regulator